MTQLRVVAGTWNVHEKDPTQQLVPEIADWLILNKTPDIVAIGLQEIEMTATAMLQEETTQKYVWDMFLKKYLRPTIYLFLECLKSCT